MPPLALHHKSYDIYNTQDVQTRVCTKMWREDMLLQFRCPLELKLALEAKASGEMNTVSACIRRLLVQGLAQEGMVITRKSDPAKSQRTAA